MARPKIFWTYDPQICSLVTLITQPIVRAPVAGRSAHRGLEIEPANRARARAPRLTAHSWNLFGTFSENIHVRSLIVKTKLMLNFNDLMWWAHKVSHFLNEFIT